MRYYLSLLFAVVLLAGVFTTESMAQAMRMTPQERAKQLKDSLGLSDQQVAQIDSIFMNMGAQRQALMDSVSDRDARRQAMMSMMKAADEKIEALLTPDQKDKYEAMKKAREEMMRQRQN